MNLAERRARLLKEQAQLTANLGFIQGQLALIDEMETAMAAETVPPQAPEQGNGTDPALT